MRTVFTYPKTGFRGRVGVCQVVNSAAARCQVRIPKNGWSTDRELSVDGMTHTVNFDAVQYNSAVNVQSRRQPSFGCVSRDDVRGEGGDQMGKWSQAPSPPPPHRRHTTHPAIITPACAASSSKTRIPKTSRSCVNSWETLLQHPRHFCPLLRCLQRPPTKLCPPTATKLSTCSTQRTAAATPSA